MKKIIVLTIMSFFIICRSVDAQAIFQKTFARRCINTNRLLRKIVPVPELWLVCFYKAGFHSVLQVRTKMGRPFS